MGGEGSSGTDHWWRTSGTCPKKSCCAAESDDDNPFGDPSVLLSFPLSACNRRSRQMLRHRLLLLYL